MSSSSLALPMTLLRAACGAVVLTALALPVTTLAQQGAGGEAPQTQPGADAAARAAGRETLLRVRALGLARLENSELDRALALLRRAAALSGGAPLDRLNLGFALLANGDLEPARAELKAVAAALPDHPSPHYALGILELRRGKLGPARARLSEALRRAPHDSATLYNLGSVEERLGGSEAAAKHYEQVMKLGWSLGGGHFLAALYRHARLLLRKGLRDEARRELKLYQDYFRRVGKPGGEADLQVGPLLWPVRVPVPPGDLPPLSDVARAPQLRIGAAVELASSPSGKDPLPGPAGRILAADLDGMGRASLLRFGDRPLALLRSVGGLRYVDRTAEAGLAAVAAGPPILDVAIADADNDGDNDLLCAGPGPLRLLRNKGDGSFEDQTAEAGLSGLQRFGRVRWLDVDQDGDLDFVALARDLPSGGPGRSRLWISRSDGTYEERREVPGLTEGRGEARDVVAADLDDDGDTDLLVARSDQWLLLLSNLREGRYEELGRSLGLAEVPAPRRVEVMDADADGRWDLATLSDRGVLPLVRRDGGFVPEGAPQLPGALALRVFDLDRDGQEELLVLDPGGKLVVLGRRDGTWTEELRLAQSPAASDLAVDDLDRDGDLDLALATAKGARILVNETSRPGRFVRVRLRGRKNNRLGLGALVEVRAGDFYARRLCDGRPMIIGVGDRGTVDTVRVRWPNGLFQNAVDPAVGGDVSVLEVQELAGSCPFLYTWDGERWRFVTDFLGSGGLGLPAGGGRYLPPDSDEYLFLDGDWLRPDADGLLRLQLTEELREEQLYLDLVRLHVVDHPEDTRIYPDERFTLPPRSSERRFAYGLGQASAPLSVIDDFGADVTELVRRRDDRMAGSFILTPEQLRGLVEPHSYILDLGRTDGVDTLWLVMTGWVFWAGGATATAAEQHPRYALGPVTLDVERDGEWVEAIPDIGFPAGKTKTMPVDLSAVLRPAEHFRVRIRTSLRLHWDEIVVVKDPQEVPVREAVLEPVRATLAYTGFHRRVDDRLDLPERFPFDQPLPPEAIRFQQAPGRLTRYGDVLELLAAADDRLAVFSAGDGVEVVFDPSELLPPPDGWRRDYLFYSEGWNKDGDPAVGAGDRVGPLPFHGMSTYPYPPGEAPADPEARARYVERFNTRPSRRLVLDLRP